MIAFFSLTARLAKPTTSASRRALKASSSVLKSRRWFHKPVAGSSCASRCAACSLRTVRKRNRGAPPGDLPTR